MRKLFAYFMMAAGVASPACWAQGLYDQLNFRNAERAGFGFYGASAFYGYSRYGETTNGRIPATSNYGGSFSLGWQHHRDKNNASILYNGSYGGLVQYPQFNKYSQALSLAGSRQLAPKWTASISAAGRDYSLSESLFQPSSLAVTSQMLTSFNDFAASFGLGQFSTSQVQSLFQNAFLESAIRSGLLGGRVLSYGGNASLNYSHSPHFSVHFGAFGAGGQALGGSELTVQGPNYAMSKSIGGDAGVNFSHSFSPRTEVGLDLVDTYVHNAYQEASVSTATASFGRKMGSRWFLRMYGGGSYSKLLAESSGPKSLQAVGGGSLGFQMLTHTLTGTYDRSAASGYGYAIGTTTNLMASWSWHRLGSRLSLFSSFGQLQQRNTGFLSISGWQAAAGFSEQLGAQTSVSVQYAYLDSTARYPGSVYSLATSSVRASLNWSPHPALR